MAAFENNSAVPAGLQGASAAAQVARDSSEHALRQGLLPRPVVWAGRAKVDAENSNQNSCLVFSALAVTHHLNSV